MATVRELVHMAAQEMGNELSDTNMLNRIRSFLPSIVECISNRTSWWWSRKQARLLIKGPYSTGTVAVSGRTATGTGTTWASSHIGWRFLFEGDNALYRAQSVDSTTSAGLESPGVSGDVAAGATYSLYKDQYVLPADFKAMMPTIGRQAETPAAMYERGDFSWFDMSLYSNTSGNPYHFRFIEPTERADLALSDTTITISTSNGVSTVEASSGVFLSSHEGAWLRVHGASRMWEIGTYTDTTHVNLVETYVNTLREAEDYHSEFGTDALSAGKKFEINPKGLIRIELKPLPSTDTIAHFDYFPNLPMVLGDAEQNPVKNGDACVMYGLMARMAEHDKLEEAGGYRRTFEGLLEQLAAKNRPSQRLRQLQMMGVRTMPTVQPPPMFGDRPWR